MNAASGGKWVGHRNSLAVIRESHAGISVIDGFGTVQDPDAHNPGVQGYAWEITTPEGGWGLHGVLQARQHVLNGITNGVDTVEWDPQTDTHTPAPFSAADLRGKAECKAALQAELGFQVNHEVRILFVHIPRIEIICHLTITECLQFARQSGIVP